MRPRHPVILAVVALPATAVITFRALAGSVAETVRDPATRGIGIVAIGIIFVATLFFHFVEGWGLLDALYYSVISLATVGYGDFVPTTALGKIGAIVMVAFGVGIIAVFFAGIASRASERAAQRAAAVRERIEERAGRVAQEAVSTDPGAGAEAGIAGVGGAAEVERQASEP
jgi:hypothetical protein